MSLFTFIDRNDLRHSVFASWLIVSCILAATVTVPLVASEHAVAAWAPQCVWKSRFGRECPACGMTTSFIDIAHGRWASAWSENRGGIPLYGGIVVNSVFWIRALARLGRRRSR